MPIDVFHFVQPSATIKSMDKPLIPEVAMDYVKNQKLPEDVESVSRNFVTYQLKPAFSVIREIIKFKNNRIVYRIWIFCTNRGIILIQSRKFNTTERKLISRIIDNASIRYLK